MATAILNNQRKDKTMIKKLISVIIISIMTISMSVQVFAADKVFIDDDFETLATSNWSDNTGRGVKTIEEYNKNKYLAFTSNGSSYYNFQAKDVYSKGAMYAEFDIKFTSNNMELQLRESRDTSSTGFTMAARLRKTAYYLEYFSNGNYYKMPKLNSNNWLELTDVSKWYTIKMSLDIANNKYSMYLIDKSSQALISKVDNIPFYGQCTYVNYFAFSSTDKLCIDNVNIRQIDIDTLRISGEIYPKIQSWGSKSYTYRANAIGDDNTSAIINDVKWSLKTPKPGVSINETTGVLSVTSKASPGPVLIYVERAYQPILNTTYLIDLEK